MLPLLLLLPVTGAYLFSHLPGPKERVDVIHINGRVKRSSDTDRVMFPPQMKYTLKLNDREVDLQLHRNYLMDAHVPVTVITNNTVTNLPIMSHSRNYAFYQMDGADSGASLLVKCPSLDKPCHLTGHFHLNGEEYAVEPDGDVLVTEDEQEDTIPHSAYKLEMKENNSNDTFYVFEDTTMEKRFKGTKKIKSKVRKRSTVTRHVIEVVMVIDHLIFDFWLKAFANDVDAARDAVRTYYELVCNNMDLRYSSITNLNIDIVPLQIVILEDDKDSSWDSYTTDSSTGRTYLIDVLKSLDAFQAWVQKHLHDLKDYDHVMAFTRGDLEVFNGTHFGYGLVGAARSSAYMDTSVVCRYPFAAVSVIEDGIMGDVSSSASHELGHSLGLIHDGLFSECKDSSQYTMSATRNKRFMKEEIAVNPWTFSSCSKLSLQNSLQRLLSDEFDCTLRGTYNVSEVKRVMDHVQPGYLYDTQEQCKIAYGFDSYRCFPLTEDICWNDMFCKGPDDACYSVHVLSGSICAYGKWCYKGSCTDIDPKYLPSQETTTVMATTVMATTTKVGTKKTTLTTTLATTTPSSSCDWMCQFSAWIKTIMG
ncbi:hypothetical protein ACJMK2_002192 [Sinanodonta woodiana]|uniref:Peptidase M12B domain-containing protein n=1 Tax=Sinanodonta woodiana TaxID=1069815 RepID=A0ABD3XXS7_SINWO